MDAGSFHNSCEIISDIRVTFGYVIIQSLMQFRKKIIVDEQGNPSKVIISWTQFREMIDALGLDLDEKAKNDLRAARRDLNQRKSTAFKSLSSL